VELTLIGHFTGSGRLVVRYGDAVVLDLSNQFLHHGLPQRKLAAILPVPEPAQDAAPVACADSAGMLLKLLAHPNIASKAAIIRIYDHEVQGGTVVKPLTGARNDGPSDAVVLKPNGTSGLTALVLGAGLNPEYGKRSPYAMAVSAVDEAVRNAVAVGADPERIALLDNFCWGDPTNPETLGKLVDASRGCYNAAVFYGTPFISGKDSLNNEYLGNDGQRHAIPPTLLISSLGVIQDLTKAVTMDLKQPGSRLYLAGDFAPVFGGSHFALVSDLPGTHSVPALPVNAPTVYRGLHQAIDAGLVRACHDLSEGGLAIAAAEMCIAGRLGLALGLEPGDPVRALFGETNGCFLVEVAPEQAADFEAAFTGLPLRRLGEVTREPLLSFRGVPAWKDLSVDELLAAWSKGA
jgi:phosphoribosylformylglycinamidine synthase